MGSTSCPGGWVRSGWAEKTKVMLNSSELVKIAKTILEYPNTI